MLPEEKARFPLAFGPPLLAAALVRPAGLIPDAPLALFPRDAWIALFLAAAAPAVTVLFARRLVREPSERTRVLTAAGVAYLAGIAAIVIGAVLASDALLYREGGAQFLLFASLAALAIVAGALAIKPRSHVLAGAVAGELVVLAALTFLLGSPSTGPEMLKRAMVLEPGWGRTSLASLARRAISKPNADDLDRWDAAIASGIESGAFAEYSDDARVVRSWLAFRRVPLSPNRRTELLRVRANESVVFATSPISSLEPFTTDGYAAPVVASFTAGLEIAPALRFRIGVAWEALEIYADGVSDPTAESETIALLRSLFVKNGLNRMHPLYVATVAIERGRLLEKGDGDAFIARLEALAKEPWPPELAAEFAGEAKFVRDHPEENYRPVMLLLRARSDASNGDVVGAEKAYREILGSWPSGPLASTARMEMAGLGKP